MQRHWLLEQMVHILTTRLWSANKATQHQCVFSSLSTVYNVGLYSQVQTREHGNSGFTSHPKEGVLRIFIALKIHRLDRVRTRDLWVQWQAH
jgi:hypothetical protein